MSEGVELLISADDQASKVLGKVADNVDAKVKQIKEVGGKAKASTEFIGVVASSLGGSQFGAAAGGIAQLTEKISEFSEVSKLGKAGALAFKAGLAGVALVAGYKIGEAIGNWWFETAKWNAEIEKANKSLLETADRTASILSTTLSVAGQKIELIDDPEEQRNALIKYHNELQDRAEQYAKELANQTAELEKQQTWFQKRFGISEAQKANDAADFAEAKKKLEAVEKERDAVAAKVRLDVDELRILKEAAALKKQNESYIQGLSQEVALLKATKDGRAAIEALQKTGGDAVAAAKAESLIREKDALLAKAEAEKEAEAAAKKSADEQIKASERIADLKKSELAKLEEQRIMLTQGKEAAHAFALEQQGLDKSTAASLASKKAKLDKLSEKGGEQGPQQSVQGRLLTRGTSDDIRKRQLDAALKMYEALTVIKENTKPWKSKTEIAFEVVGR